jgi:hypothetical protein
MKPNVKSTYFTSSLISFAAYLGTLLFLRLYVVKNLTAGLPTPLLTPLTIVGYIFVGIGCASWYISSHPKATLPVRLAILLVSPFALSPLLAVLYISFVLLPIYGIAGRI